MVRSIDMFFRRAGRRLGVPGVFCGSGWVPALRGTPSEFLLSSGAWPVAGLSFPSVAGRARASISEPVP